MDNHVSKSEFKAKALEYFRLVETSGESLVVTDHGRPVLELRPYREEDRSPLDMLRGTLVRYDDPLEPVGDDWDSTR
jgi:antitoxin (DNA-binding transcriptional repressor) of toxin-antitoxin stability system